jgi:hypothetical protein
MYFHNSILATKLKMSRSSRHNRSDAEADIEAINNDRASTSTKTSFANLLGSKTGQGEDKENIQVVIGWSEHFDEKKVKFIVSLHGSY